MRPPRRLRALLLAVAASLAAWRGWREFQGRSALAEYGQLIRLPGGSGALAGPGAAARARPILDRAIAQKSVSSEAWVEAARRGVESGSAPVPAASGDPLKEAFDAVEASLRANPLNTRAWMTGYQAVETASILGRAHWILALGSKPSVLSKGFIEGAVRTNPNGADLQRDLGTFLLAAGERDEALVHFRRAAALGLDPLRIGREMLDSGFTAGEVADALPRRADIQNGLGRLLLERGEDTIGEEALVRAAKLEPGNWETWATLARAAQGAGRHAQALAYAKNVLPLIDNLRAPARAELFVTLAVSSRAVGDLDGAAAYAQRATEADPHHLFARNLLGSILQQKGDLAGAIRAWQGLLDAYPNEMYVIENLASFHRSIGGCYEKLAMREHAIEHYREVLSVRPSDPEARAALIRLNAR